MNGINTYTILFVLALLPLITKGQQPYNDDRITKGNIVHFKECVFEVDTTTRYNYIKNPVTGVYEKKGATAPDPEPLTVNRKKIYANLDPHVKATDQSFIYYLQDVYKEEFAMISEGGYSFNLSKIVVNEHGNIVYYNFDGIHKCLLMRPKNYTKQELDKMNNKLVHILNTTTFKPATLQGKPVPSLISYVISNCIPPPSVAVDK